MQFCPILRLHLDKLNAHAFCGVCISHNRASAHLSRGQIKNQFNRGTFRRRVGVMQVESAKAHRLHARRACFPERFPSHPRAFGRANARVLARLVGCRCHAYVKSIRREPQSRYFRRRFRSMSNGRNKSATVRGMVNLRLEYSALDVVPSAKIPLSAIWTWP